MNFNKTKFARTVFTVLYFLIAMLLLLSHIDSMFYLEPKPDSFNFDRFLWCVVASCLGFTVLSLHTLDHPNSPFPSFLTYYPFFLLVFSTLVFSICHLFEKSSTFVFYYLSFTCCFLLSYTVDRFWTIVGTLIKTRGK